MPYGIKSLADVFRLRRCSGLPSPAVSFFRPRVSRLVVVRPAEHDPCADPKDDLFWLREPPVYVHPTLLELVAMSTPLSAALITLFSAFACLIRPDIMHWVTVFVLCLFYWSSLRSSKLAHYSRFVDENMWWWLFLSNNDVEDAKIRYAKTVRRRAKRRGVMAA